MNMTIEVSEDQAAVLKGYRLRLTARPGARLRYVPGGPA